VFGRASKGEGPIEDCMKSSKVRQVLLGLTAAVFVAIAIASLLAPQAMAQELGYALLSVDALSEFRAIYVGLWLATAVLLVVAIRRVEVALLGDFCAILVLGQTGGRIMSLLLDGIPSMRVWPIFLLEAVGGIALLVVRPSVTSSTMSGPVDQAEPADEVRDNDGRGPRS
jgi:ABC-type thiamin/hydroxymethylpyrimidine transport system permease subunit